MIFVAEATGRSVPKTCETGEQGGLAVGLYLLVHESGKCVWVIVKSIQLKLMNSRLLESGFCYLYTAVL